MLPDSCSLLRIRVLLNDGLVRDFQIELYTALLEEWRFC